MINSIFTRGRPALAVLVALLFLGALFWARGRDPFQRVWFSVRTPAGEKAQCVAVLPRNAPQPYPVVVYLHGAGASLLSLGKDLRQMVELGLAAVAIEYSETNDATCDRQVAALLRHLQRQKWADTNAMAWLGFSLGAEKATRYWLKHPEDRPGLLVRLAGGWLPELEQFKARDSALSPSSLILHPSSLNRPPLAPRPSVLLLHSDRDELFPLADTERMAALFRTNGVAVEQRVLPGVPHNLGADRALVFRCIAERCLTHLRGPDALAHYRSIAAWQSAAWPLWIFCLPALAWGLVSFLPRSRGRQSAPSSPSTRATPVAANVNSQSAAPPVAASRQSAVSGSSIILRWLAALLALAALALTALHLVTPQFPVSERTLSVARRFLVSPKARADFEWLAAQPRWEGQRLGTLLQHAELAGYNRGLVSWTVDDATHRDFVLSPFIQPGDALELHWRRTLWENLYPRIRKEQSVEEAAAIVVRHLRERVTVAPGAGSPDGIETTWRRQITDAAGFQRLFVAGLRSAGIPARLNEQAQPEFLADGKWHPAPRPSPLET